MQKLIDIFWVQAISFVSIDVIVIDNCQILVKMGHFPSYEFFYGFYKEGGGHNIPLLKSGKTRKSLILTGLIHQ